MKLFTAHRKERGTAFIEVILALPLFMMLICLIVEVGHMLIARSAVDDAAYNVAHAYSKDPSIGGNSNHNTDELLEVTKIGPLANVDDDYLDVKCDLITDGEYEYTHHLPNYLDYEPAFVENDHYIFYNEWRVSVEYKMLPVTFIGDALAFAIDGDEVNVPTDDGGVRKVKTIPIGASSECIVDKTVESPNGGWWTGTYE